MRFVILLVFPIFSFLFASELILSKQFNVLYASKYMEYVHDINSSFQIGNISQASWKPLHNSNLSGAKMYPSWTRFVIRNASSLPAHLFLKNPRAGMDEIDVYVVRKNSIETYHLGDSRNIYMREIQHRNALVSLKLDKDEKVTIFTRLVNRIGSTEGEWIIYSEQSFYRYDTLENIWWGIYVGIIVALLLYAIPILMAAKDIKLALYFTLYALSSLLYQLSVNGFMYLIGVDSTYINHLVLFFAISFGMFGIVFILRFLQIENRRGIIYWSILFFGLLLGVEYLILFGSLFNDSMMNIIGSINVYIGLFAYVIWLAMIRDFIKISKDPVFRYLFMGYTIVILAYALQALVSAGLTEISSISIYGVSVATLIEILFFVFGMSEYLRKLEADQKKKDRLIDFQMRFASIGKVIGNISHQWKIPLVRSGTLLTQLETTLHYKKDSVAEELVEIIPQMRSNLEFMQNTVDEFYQLYSSQASTELFKPDKIVMDIWSMLHAKALKNNSRIQFLKRDDILIRSFPHLFEHVVMILIDNMLNIANERNIKSTYMYVSLEGNGNHCTLVFEDNCGGIRQSPIESIFEMDISSKTIEHGGMGLTMAKMIVEEKLRGKITVINGTDGAIFTITLVDLSG